MNLSNFDWNNKYSLFIDYLYSLQDLKYQTFHSKLLKDDNVNLIGIRVPILKEIAKEIAKGDYPSFIKNNTHKTYEENMIHGLVIGYVKEPFKDVLVLLDNFIPYNDNWAVNDTVCANMKVFKKNLDEGYQYILKLITSNETWKIRFGLVLLLDFYINETYLNDIFRICDNIKNKDYYVQMAVAWLISICFIKYQTDTYNYLLNNKLDTFTFNKTISKICDSYRVEKDIKVELKKIRR